jgi:ribosomal-protein-alanine N-acetyltransferase
MKPVHIIQTKRLTLKSVSPANVHELFKSKSKEEIKKFFDCDEKGYEFYLDMHQNGMETNRISLLFFQIFHSESKQLLGEFGFHTWNRSHKRAELYYFLKNDEDKMHGFMSEVMESLLNFGFNTLNLHRIEAKVAPWNTASTKLLEKFHFTFEGTMREDYCVDGINEDSNCYSLLKPEWHNKN